MSPPESVPDPAVTTIVFEPNITCDSCGRYGAYRFDGRDLCEDCVAGACSCCPEFGKDDLWADQED